MTQDVSESRDRNCQPDEDRVRQRSIEMQVWSVKQAGSDHAATTLMRSGGNAVITIRLRGGSLEYAAHNPSQGTENLRRPPLQHPTSASMLHAEAGPLAILRVCNRRESTVEQQQRALQSLVANIRPDLAAC